MNWPGSANVSIACLWICKKQWKGQAILQGAAVERIGSLLTEASELSDPPKRLQENVGIALSGSYVYGEGFVLDVAEAQKLIKEDPKNQKVIYPYLIGEAFNSRPDQSFDRYVINFFDWPLTRAPTGKSDYCAEDFPACLEIVRARVKPERDLVKEERTRERWWQYGRRAVDLYEAIKNKKKVLFHAFTSKYVAIAFVPADLVYAQPHIVIAFDDYWHFAVLQSNFHTLWVEERSSKMGLRVRYVASDVFDTFPFPKFDQLSALRVETVGRAVYDARSAIMLSHSIGLTDFYSCFHDPGENSEDVTRLRELHVEMDRAVASAYGWSDLDLNRSFHETKQGLRYTLCASVRRTLLERLLKLNRQRHSDEVTAKTAQALSTPTKRGRKKKVKAGSMMLDLL